MLEMKIGLIIPSEGGSDLPYSGGKENPDCHTKMGKKTQTVTLKYYSHLIIGY